MLVEELDPAGVSLAPPLLLPHLAEGAPKVRERGRRWSSLGARCIFRAPLRPTRGAGNFTSGAKGAHKVRKKGRGHLENECWSKDWTQLVLASPRRFFPRTYRGTSLIRNSPPPQDHHRKQSGLGLSQSQAQVFTKIGAHFRQRSFVKMGCTRISRRLAMAFGTTLGISGKFGTNKKFKARFKPWLEPISGTGFQQNSGCTGISRRLAMAFGTTLGGGGLAIVSPRTLMGQGCRFMV